MGWLLSRVTGNPMLLIWIALGAFVLGAASGGGAAWKVQGWRIDKVQADFDKFVGETRVLGEAAKKEKADKEASDKRNKELTDAENKRTIDGLRTTVSKLRNARAGSGFVPGAASPTGRPDRACFDRAELESAIRGLDQEVQGFVDKGSEAVVNLNSAKIWAGGIGSPGK